MLQYHEMLMSVHDALRSASIRVRYFAQVTSSLALALALTLADPSPVARTASAAQRILPRPCSRVRYIRCAGAAGQEGAAQVGSGATQPPRRQARPARRPDRRRHPRHLGAAAWSKWPA